MFISPATEGFGDFVIEQKTCLGNYRVLKSYLRVFSVTLRLTSQISMAQHKKGMHSRKNSFFRGVNENTLPMPQWTATHLWP